MQACFLQGTAAIQFGIAGERVDLQHVGEVCKMPLGIPVDFRGPLAPSI